VEYFGSLHAHRFHSSDIDETIYGSELGTGRRHGSVFRTGLHSLLTASIIFHSLSSCRLSHTRGLARFISFLPVGSSWQNILRGCRARAGSGQKLMMGVEGDRPREYTLHVHARSLVTGMVFSFSFGLIMSYIGQTLSGGDVAFSISWYPLILHGLTSGVGGRVIFSFHFLRAHVFGFVASGIEHVLVLANECLVLSILSVAETKA